MHYKFPAPAICFLMFLLVSFSSYAQKYTVSGTIKDKKTGEVLIGATIAVADSPALGAVSNEYGFYSLTIPKGRYRLVFRYVSYKEQVQEVDLTKNVKLDIAAETID